MANDIYTMTPGSQVAETLQGILQRKRDTERQIMLDRLGLEKARLDDEQTRHGMGLQDSQLEIQKQAEARAGRQTDASVRHTNAQTDNALLQNLPVGRTSASGMSPEIQRILTERGMLESMPTASVGTSTEFTPEMEPDVSDHFAPIAGDSETTTTQGGEKMYIGNEDFQKSEIERNRILELLNGGIVEEEDPLKTVLQGAAAGVNIPTGALPGRTTVLSPGGQTRQTITGRQGDNVIELNHPPNAPAAAMPSLFQIPGPDGTSQSHWLRPGEQPTEKTLMQGVEGQARKGNMPTTPAQDMVPADVRQRLVTARATQSPNDDPQAITNAITNARVDQSVKDAVREMYDYATGIDSATGQPLQNWTKPSFEQVIGMLDPNFVEPPLTPQEVNQVHTLLQMILGGN
jgi:hypothetical protein